MKTEMMKRIKRQKQEERVHVVKSSHYSRLHKQSYVKWVNYKKSHTERNLTGSPEIRSIAVVLCHCSNSTTVTEISSKILARKNISKVQISKQPQYHFCG